MSVLSDPPEPPGPAEPDDSAARKQQRDAARALAATAGIVSLVVGATIIEVCAKSRPESAEARCSALLDRFVALRARADNPKATDHAVEQLQAEARAEAERTQALARCREQLTEDTAACADKARSADDLDRCFP